MTEDALQSSEVVSPNEYAGCEKAEVVEAVATIVDSLEKKGVPARVLICGGPGVGKSTASYEVIDYLEAKGKKSLWIQPGEFGSEFTRERIRDMDAGTVLFVDSFEFWTVFCVIYFPSKRVYLYSICVSACEILILSSNFTLFD